MGHPGGLPANTSSNQLGIWGGGKDLGGSGGGCPPSMAPSWGFWGGCPGSEHPEVRGEGVEVKSSWGPCPEGRPEAFGFECFIINY